MSNKGKNYSCNNVAGKRRKSDFYETPYSMTRQFLDAEHIPRDKVILEPACGNGAIVRVLEEFSYTVIAKSIEQGDDFLLEVERHDAVITNPPYSLAYEFIEKCKEITKYFALLLPLSYLHGKARYDNVYMDKDFPLSRIYVFTRYPLLGDRPREDGKYRTGMMVYAWFVWDNNTKGRRPEIYWLDNNCFVLSSRDSQ